MIKKTTVPRRAAEAEARQRILESAHRAFLTHGFAGTTMDDLAREVGMSKKTLYRFFTSKEALADALVTAKIESITTGLAAIMGDDGAEFSIRARRVLDHVLMELSGVSPVFLRDLKRFAPRIYRRIETVRRRVIPEVWGRLITKGRDEGLVRADIDPAFATEIMLQAVQGILSPETLERLHLSPRQAYAQTTNLLLGGLLTAAGRRDHEKTQRS